MLFPTSTFRAWERRSRFGVPPDLVERAKSVLMDNQVTEAELTDLALSTPQDEASRDPS